MKELDLREEIFKEFLTSNPEGLFESVLEDTAAFIERNENLSKDFLKTPISQWQKEFKDFLLERFNPNEFEKTFDCFDKAFKKIIERRQLKIINKIKRKFNKVKKGEELTLVSTLIDHNFTLQELQRYYYSSSSIIYHLIESQTGGLKKFFDEDLEEPLAFPEFYMSKSYDKDGKIACHLIVKNTLEGENDHLSTNE